MATLDILAPEDLEGTTAVVRNWLKRVGEPVEADEAVVELETDKVAMEVFAPSAGVVAELCMEPGDEAGPGALLARLSVGDVAPTPAEEACTAHASAVAQPAPALEAARARQLGEFHPALRLSPAVRRYLVECGGDPTGLVGTGRDGRLTLADVKALFGPRQAVAADAPEIRPAAIPERPPPPPAPSSPPRALAPPAVAIGARFQPHDTMRLRIAEHMSRSVATAPHVTAVFEADFTRIIAHRNALKAGLAARGVQLTLTAYFIQAAVQAMAAAPAVNSRWRDDGLELFDDVNVGVGAALGERGLIVPVVHKAQSLSLSGIAERLQTLLEQARAGRLRPADVQGGTFSISNHGVSGSLMAAPIIINQPQSAILGVGKLEKRVVVRELEGVDGMVIRPMAFVSLSIDHRVLDGFQTNAWLTRFVQTLETWPAL